MSLKTVGQDMWNEAYERGGGILYFIHMKRSFVF